MSEYFERGVLMEREIFEEQIPAIAKKLLREVSVCNGYLKIYKELSDNQEEYKDVLQASPAYFNLTIRANTTTLVLDLCKLFEPPQ